MLAMMKMITKRRTSTMLIELKRRKKRSITGTATIVIMIIVTNTTDITTTNPIPQQQPRLHNERAEAFGQNKKSTLRHHQVGSITWMLWILNRVDIPWVHLMVMGVGVAVAVALEAY